MLSFRPREADASCKSQIAPCSCRAESCVGDGTGPTCEPEESLDRHILSDFIDHPKKINTVLCQIRSLFSVGHSDGAFSALPLRQRSRFPSPPQMGRVRHSAHMPPGRKGRAGGRRGILPAPANGDGREIGQVAGHSEEKDEGGPGLRPRQGMLSLAPDAGPTQDDAERDQSCQNGRQLPERIAEGLAVAQSMMTVHFRHRSGPEYQNGAHNPGRRTGGRIVQPLEASRSVGTGFRQGHLSSFEHFTRRRGPKQRCLVVAGERIASARGHQGLVVWEQVDCQGLGAKRFGNRILRNRLAVEGGGRRSSWDIERPPVARISVRRRPANVPPM